MGRADLQAHQKGGLRAHMKGSIVKHLRRVDLQAQVDLPAHQEVRPSSTS